MISADINLKDLTYIINLVPKISDPHYKLGTQNIQPT